MSDGTDVFTVDSLDEDQQAQAEVTAVFGEDGRASFTIMGEERTGAWAPTGADTLIINFDPIEGFDEIPAYTGTLDDGTLAIDEDGLVMLLEKEK